MGQNIWSSCFRYWTKGVLSRRERKQTRWVLEAHYWPWYREEELKEIMAVSVSWENWVHSLGRLRGLEFGGTHTGEERANQGKVQKSARVPLGLLLNTKWAYIERNFTNLGNYWRAVSWTFPRNYTGMGGVLSSQRHYWTPGAFGRDPRRTRLSRRGRP